MTFSSQTELALLEINSNAAMKTTSKNSFSTTQSWPGSLPANHTAAIRRCVRRSFNDMLNRRISSASTEKNATAFQFMPTTFLTYISVAYENVFLVELRYSKKRKNQVKYYK